ncbi:hypothetical protein BABINDRAFT_8469 [Babjeviella inositovora NRRL Y-12698]|uniref:Uncharacterized protein n=1 Tax=Babjeviella inositovora NRRL Y-12698 TaxID=984486 RepID=A0A1E3QRI6_9ASCO|nr:uncharacterized protein BABINDRAFT_8469 [Babjeviella inositovora NRRL Y-12698]ODQ79557.1 hypothetical protein BABINDRAFT_8469 [Babjeviella inositovora NRRL Y-12698]
MYSPFTPQPFGIYQPAYCPATASPAYASDSLNTLLKHIANQSATFQSQVSAPREGFKPRVTLKHLADGDYQITIAKHAAGGEDVFADYQIKFYNRSSTVSDLEIVSESDKLVKVFQFDAGDYDLSQTSYTTVDDSYLAIRVPYISRRKQELQKQKLQKQLLKQQQEEAARLAALQKAQAEREFVRQQTVKALERQMQQEFARKVQEAEEARKAQQELQQAAIRAYQQIQAEAYGKRAEQAQQFLFHSFVGPYSFAHPLAVSASVPQTQCQSSPFSDTVPRVSEPPSPRPVTNSPIPQVVKKPESQVLSKKPTIVSVSAPAELPTKTLVKAPSLEEVEDEEFKGFQLK